MRTSKLTINIIVLSVYILTLFCGVGTLINSSIIDTIRLILQLGLPFLICVSIIKDQFGNLKIFKKYKFCLFLIILNIIWFILSITFGISIGSQSIKGLFTFVNILLILFLLANINLSYEDAKRIKKAIYISAFICAIYGIIQYVFQINLNTFENAKYPGIFGRINSTFYIATLLDKYMVLIFAISCYNLLKSKHIFFKLLFLVTGINVILTFARSGLIALIFVLFIFLIVSLIKKYFRNIILTIILLVVAFLIPGVNHLFQLTADYGYNILNIPEALRINFVYQDKTVVDNESDIDIAEKDKDKNKNDMSLEFREYYDNIGLQFAKENPIFGIGLNNYSYLYNNQNAAEFLDDDSVLQEDLKYMYPHNGYIQLSSEIGYVGMILVLLYLGYICFNFLLHNKIKYKSFSLLLLLLFLLGSYTESLIYNKQLSFIFMILFALYSNPSFYNENDDTNMLCKKTNKNKKKLTFLLLHLGSGGIETATVNTANSLSSKYDVTLLCLYEKDNEIIDLVDKNVKVIHLLNYSSNRDIIKEYIKNKNLFKLIKELFRAIKILYLKKYLIKEYILNSNDDIIISTRMEFSILLSKYGNKDTLKIACEHQHHNNNKKYINNIKFKYNNLDILVALTQSLADDYKSFMKKNKKIKILTIPNMVQDEQVNITNLKNKRIVSIGRLHPGKRVDEIINIFEKLDTDYKLDIAGDGEEYQKLKEMIKDKKLNKKVKLLGNLNRSQVNKLLEKSDIFVMTSISEGLPMVLIEAMRAGVVCVAYETDSGVNDIIDNNENGYVIKNRNQDEYVEKLQYLINNPKELKKMQTKAINKSKKYLSKNITKKWIEVIEEK